MGSAHFWKPGSRFLDSNSHSGFIFPAPPHPLESHGLFITKKQKLPLVSGSLALTVHPFLTILIHDNLSTTRWLEVSLAPPP